MPNDHLDETRTALWAAAQPLVAELGWSDPLLERAAQEAGIEPGLAQLAFPDGAHNLLQFASQQSDEDLLRILETTDLQAMKIRERITFAVRKRIELMADHKSSVKRTMTTLVLPHNGVLATKLLYATVDTIWFGIGDTSTDFNFYTKRATLSAVYTSTVLYWLTDESQDSQPTWDFLDNRIENVMSFEKVKAQARKTMAQLPSLLLRFCHFSRHFVVRPNSCPLMPK